MKKIGEYTTRGSILTNDEVNRIILFDGRFDTAYRVVEFVVGPHDMDSTNTRCFASKLMTDEGAAGGINWNWDSNTEIAWSSFTNDQNAPQSPNNFSLVDPDNLIVEDLYIIAEETTTSNVLKMNYYIRLEKYDITDSQGALSMVRARSQA